MRVHLVLVGLTSVGAIVPAVAADPPETESVRSGGQRARGDEVSA